MSFSFSEKRELRGDRVKDFSLSFEINHQFALITGCPFTRAFERRTMLLVIKFLIFWHAWQVGPKVLVHLGKVFINTEKISFQAY